MEGLRQNLVMKTFTILLVIWNFTLLSQVNPNYHWVNGYHRQNGTYVEGYYRTDQNYTKDDNYTTIGNVNPHTGSHGYLPRDNYNPTYYSPSSFSKYDFYFDADAAVKRMERERELENAILKIRYENESIEGIGEVEEETQQKVTEVKYIEEPETHAIELVKTVPINIPKVESRKTYLDKPTKASFDDILAVILVFLGIPVLLALFSSK